MNKSEYLVVGDKAGGIQFEMGRIEATERFKYLGVQITSNSGSIEEVNARLGQARAATRQTNGLLWSNTTTKENKK